MTTRSALGSRLSFTPSVLGNFLSYSHAIAPAAVNRHSHPQHRTMESNAKLRWGAACLNCRKYKIRCDGAKPMCSRCVQFGRADCAYGRGPPPSLDARLQQQFADFGQRVGVIAPAGNQGTSRGASEAALATGSSSRSRTPASVTSRDPVPVEFPGPSDIPGLAEWDRQSELPPYTRQLMYICSIVASDSTS